MQPITNANSLVTRFVGLGNVAIYLLMVLATIYIIWNVVQYVIRGNTGSDKRKEAVQNIIWGIVGLAIIMSIWGLVNILLNTFYTGGLNEPPRPIPNADFVNPGAGFTAPTSPRLYDAPNNYGRFDGAQPI